MGAVNARERPGIDGKIRILHVDDDAPFSNLTAKFLERRDQTLEVISETDPTEALRRLEQRPIDCIVSDYQMPGMDGLDLLETVRKAYPDLPFILFTGKGSEEIASDAISAGVTDYLQKSDGTDQYAVLAKQIESAVDRHRAESRVETFLWSAPDGIVVVSPDGTITETNAALRSIFGYDDGELVGEDVEILVPEAQREVHVAHRERYIESPDRRPMGADLNLQGRKKDGERFPVDVSLSPIHLGERVEIMAAVRDMSERQRLRDRAERESELTDRVLDTSPVGILVRDTDDGSVTRVNRRAKEILSTPRDDSDERVPTIEEMDPCDRGGNPLDRHELPFERVQATGSPVEAETLLLSTDEGRRWLRINCTPLGDAGVDRVVYAFEDVSEQIRHERERRGRLDRVTDAFVALDDEWYITYLNEKAASLLDRDPEDLVGEKMCEQFPEAMGTQFFDAYNRAMASQESVEIEEYYEPLDRWFEVRAYPSDTGLSLYFRDVTERKERERRYNATFNQTFQFTGLLEPDGTLVEANEAALEFGGVERDQVVGEKMWETYWFQHGDAAERGREAVERAREGELVRDEIEVQGDDRVATIDFSVKPVTDERGTVDFLVPEGRDITRLKERERELRKERAILESIFEVQPDVFYLFDRDGQFLRWNEQFGEVTGYSDEAISEMGPLDFVPADDEDVITDAIRRVFEGESVVVESALITEEGDHIPHEFTGALVEDEEYGVVGLAGIGRDISDRKECQRELEQQNDRLEEFASVVSHDLRNPLTVVEANLELARAECDSEHLADAASSVERMEDMIADMLTLAREGQVVNEKQRVDVATVAERAWETVKTSGAKLDTETTSVAADPGRLRELLENLFRNAVEHGGDDVTVRIGLLDDGFYVEDDGPGIPADERETIFESGYTTSGTGNGFGLAIVRSIAQAHGWTIALVESDAGGARLEITGLNTDRSS